MQEGAREKAMAKGDAVQWRAVHRFARISPTKARLVMNTIRGKSCEEALASLRFNRRRSAGMILNVVKSAMANAGESEANLRSLWIVDARVDGGPMYKRWQPKDRGRAHPTLKRTSHLQVTVAPA